MEGGETWRALGMREQADVYSGNRLKTFAGATLVKACGSREYINICMDWPRSFLDKCGALTNCWANILKAYRRPQSMSRGYICGFEAADFREGRHTGQQYFFLLRIPSKQNTASPLFASAATPPHTSTSAMAPKRLNSPLSRLT